jgi:hypothetical protein
LPLLLDQRGVDEIVARLTTAELDQVFKIVGGLGEVVRRERTLPLKNNEKGGQCRCPPGPSS